MQKELYKKYAMVRAERAEIEAKEALLKEQILEDMQKSGNSKLELDFGKFTVCMKKTWTYSKKVEKMLNEVKIQKYTEEESGKAKVEVTNYLAFKAPSEE